jgi:hypothetical protein
MTRCTTIVGLIFAMLYLLVLPGCQETTIHLKPDGSGTVETLATLRRTDLKDVDDYKKDAKAFEADTIKKLTEAASLPVNTRGLSAPHITTISNDKEFGIKVECSFRRIDEVEISACSLWMNDKDTDASRASSSMVRFTFDGKDDGGKLKIRLPADLCADKVFREKTLARDLLKMVAPPSGSGDSLDAVARSGVSINIQIEGGISKTNSLFSTSDTVTLFSFKDPPAQDVTTLQAAQSQSLEKKKDAEALLKSLLGLKMNLNPEIEMKWKTAGR